MAALSFTPESRFVATVTNATFHTQIGKTIYTKVERLKHDGSLGSDLTWRTARGARVCLFGRWCFYAPAFFWRKLR